MLETDINKLIAFIKENSEPPPNQYDKGIQSKRTVIVRGSYDILTKEETIFLECKAYYEEDKETGNPWITFAPVLNGGVLYHKSIREKDYLPVVTAWIETEKAPENLLELLDLNVK